MVGASWDRIAKRWVVIGDFGDAKSVLDALWGHDRGIQVGGGGAAGSFAMHVFFLSNLREGFSSLIWIGF